MTAFAIHTDVFKVNWKTTGVAESSLPYHLIADGIHFHEGMGQKHLPL